MNVLLSIRPKYVERIIDGRKKYEFRKHPLRRHVDEAWIYATSPTKKIVGTFVVGQTIQDSPLNLWDRLNTQSGMSREEFLEFFRGKERVFAMEIKSFSLFQNPVDPKRLFPGFIPPQSLRYFEMGSVDGH
jgi:type I restriction enzyme S subunit